MMNISRKLTLPLCLYVLGGFLSTLLLSCTFVSSSFDDGLSKSPNDAKDYRYVTLENGLKALLISDPKADIAAVSMDVRVGSMDDPKHRQGLAHFVEHMLFLGTKKYPEADAFMQFIKAEGGRSNAFTTIEHTNYHFTIKVDALSQGVDQFAQFFISPLFDKAYVDREIQSIEAEFKSKIQNDKRRILDVYKTLANPDNAWSQFTVGNLETLRPEDPELLVDMKAFYKAYYLAGNMTLSIIGPQSLDELNTLVSTAFSEVPAGFVDRSPVEAPLFKEGDLPKWVTIKPERNLRELSLLFPMPDFRDNYRAKPLLLVGHILGHEGKGSLYAYLKENHWIESLVAGEPISYHGGEVFSLRIGLTDEGLKNQQAVIEAVFAAIKRLKEEGIPKWVFSELAEINQLVYLFPQEAPALTTVIYYAASMHDYPEADLLQASTMLEDYRPDLIQKAIDSLTVDNLLVSVAANDFTFVDLTHFYQVPYTQAPMPRQLRQSLAEVTVNPAIVTPEKNTLLPDKLALPEASKSQEPSRLQHKKWGELWYKPVVNFVTPRAMQIYSFQYEPLTRNIKEDLALDLYVTLINDSLEYYVYPAYLAGLNFSIYRQGYGINLQLSGFSDKQYDLLKDIVRHVQSTTFTEKQFERIQREAVRKVANLYYEQPFRRALSVWQEKMRPDLWPYEDIKLALPLLTLDDVEQAAKTFWQDAGLLAFVNGDYSKKQAEKSTAFMKSSFHLSASDALNSLKSKVVKLEEPVYAELESAYEDTGYLYYWQAPDDAIATQASWLIFSKLLEAGFYHELRTQQQLGYVVMSYYYPLINVPGLLFLVQSPDSQVEAIHAATLQYLNDTITKLDLFSIGQFEKYQSSLVEQLSEKPKNLMEESGEYWAELYYGFSFDRKAQLIKALKAVDFERWKAHIKQAYKALPHKSFLMGTQPVSELGAYQHMFKPAGKTSLYIYPRSKKK